MSDGRYDKLNSKLIFPTFATRGFCNEGRNRFLQQQGGEAHDKVSVSATFYMSHNLNSLKATI